MSLSPLRNLLNLIAEDNYPFGSLPEWVDEIRFYEKLREKITEILLLRLEEERQKGNEPTKMFLHIGDLWTIMVPLHSNHVSTCTVKPGSSYIVSRSVIKELDQIE